METITKENIMFFLSTNQVKQGVPLEKIKATVPKHIQWIKKQIAAGAIVQAGKWGDIGGMCIINAESKKAALELLEKDPIIEAGISEMMLDEFFPDVPIECIRQPIDNRK